MERTVLVPNNEMRYQFAFSNQQSWVPDSGGQVENQSGPITLARAERYSHGSTCCLRLFKHALSFGRGKVLVPILVVDSDDARIWIQQAVAPMRADCVFVEASFDCYHAEDF